MHAIVPPGRNADLQSAGDDELLRRFVAVRDQVAFEEIVRRHGPLVLSVCRRVVGHLQDAEDAFQATFLTLASRAGKIKRGVALPSWLHRVATRIARTLQRNNARRQKNMTTVEPEKLRVPAANEGAELKLMLDDELDRLPAKYKSAILLCDYYGYSRKDAASALKIPMGTLLTNLHRGRELLKKRLLRCGVAVSAVGVASALAKTASAAAPVSAELVHSTARLSLLFLAGQAATKSAARTTAVHLAQTTIRRMTMMKLLSMSLLCAAVGTIAVAVPEIAQTNSARAQPFFVDDFEDGNATDGNPFTWLPDSITFTQAVVSNGDLVIRSDSTDRDAPGYYISELTDLRDGLFRTQLRFAEANGDFAFAGIFARNSQPSTPAYIGGIFADGRIRIVELADSLVQFPTEREISTSLDPMTNDVLIELELLGTRVGLRAWEPGSDRPAQPQLSFTDDTLSEGTVGLFLDTLGGPAEVRFRSFTSVPEPATAGVAVMGLASLGGFVLLRRRKHD